MTVQLLRRRLDGTPDCQNFGCYLRTSTTFDATDKRDRAYALLGLATDINSNSFLVSYSESIDEVCMRVTRYLIENGDGVYALYKSIGINERCSSWAFDLAGDTPRDTLRNHVNGTGYSKVLRAQGDSKTCMSVHSDKSLLRVTGFIFGRIKSLISANTPADTLDWILEVSRWTKELRSYPLGPVEPMACWRATFLDCVIDSLGQACRYEESPEIEDDFVAFISSVYILRTHLGNDRIGKTIDAAFEPVLLKMIPMIKNIHTSTGRRPVCTTDGLVCLVPGNAHVGDHLSISHGAPIPFVLREEDDHFRIVGSAYIHNMMDGQAFETDRWKAEDIILR